MRTLFRHDPRTLLMILGTTLLIPLAAFAAIACTDDSGPATGGSVTIAVGGGSTANSGASKGHSERPAESVKTFSIYETIVRAPHVSPPTLCLRLKTTP